MILVFIIRYDEIPPIKNRHSHCNVMIQFIALNISVMLSECTAESLSYRPSEGPCQLLTKRLLALRVMSAALSKRQTGQSLLSYSRSLVVQRSLEFMHQKSSCETTSEVQSPVVTHARLGQTPVGGPQWRFSMTAGPAKKWSRSEKEWSY